MRDHDHASAEAMDFLASLASLLHLTSHAKLRLTMSPLSVDLTLCLLMTPAVGLEKESHIVAGLWIGHTR